MCLSPEHEAVGLPGPVDTLHDDDDRPAPEKTEIEIYVQVVEKR